MGENRLYESAIKWEHSTDAETVVLRTGQARLLRIVVGNGAGGTFTVYNNTAGSGDTVAVLDVANNNEGTFEFGGIILDVGLTIVNSAGSNSVTVIYE